MRDATRILHDSEFGALVNSRASTLFGVVGRLGTPDLMDIESTLTLLTRPLLAVMHSEASHLEEILDGYGAKRNERWRPFRALIAAIKLFARVHYLLIHVSHGVPRYRLLSEHEDLGAGLLEARRFTARVLLMASRRVAAMAPSLWLTLPKVEIREASLPLGRLPEDCGLRRVDVAETVTRLATAFLKQAGEARLLAPTAWSRADGSNT